MASLGRCVRVLHLVAGAGSQVSAPGIEPASFPDQDQSYFCRPRRRVRTTVALRYTRAARADAIASADSLPRDWLVITSGAPSEEVPKTVSAPIVVVCTSAPGPTSRPAGSA